MGRPGFLSNKRVSCDFCGQESFGNINTANLFMCNKCLRYLCSTTDELKIKFLGKFEGKKDKERVIKRFINEEVSINGSEATVNQQYPFGGNDFKGFFRVTPNKIWKKSDYFKLDKAGT